MFRYDLTAYRTSKSLEAEYLDNTDTNPSNSVSEFLSMRLIETMSNTLVGDEVESYIRGVNVAKVAT